MNPVGVDIRHVALAFGASSTPAGRVGTAGAPRLFFGPRAVARSGSSKSRARARDKVGSVGFAAMVGLCTVLWATQPWSPSPPSAAAVAWGSLIMWVLPPWSQWADGHRRQIT